MPRYADEITALLRSMIWGEPLSCDPSVLLEPELWYVARRQQMDHMLAVWALNQGLPVIQPQELKLRVFHTLQRTERQKAILQQTVRVLRDQKIEPVLIKGHSIAVLYPNPDMRSSADVDMYIGEQEYDHMIAVMRAAFPEAYWFSEEHAGLHFAVVMDEKLDLAVELHRVAMELHNIPDGDRAFQDFTHREMAHTRTLRVGDTDVSIPSLAFDALYIFMHAWHHFESSGVGLRQLADWSLALHAAKDVQGLDETLRPVLERMQMLEVWQTFGWVLVHYLGLPREEFLSIRSVVPGRAAAVLPTHQGWALRTRTEAPAVWPYALLLPLSATGEGTASPEDIYPAALDVPDDADAQTLSALCLSELLRGTDQKKALTPIGLTLFFCMSYLSYRPTNGPSILSSTPAATAEPITPATFGPIACISRKFDGFSS